RYPQFQLPDGIQGMYQSEGGIAAAAKGNAAHQRMARKLGATLTENAPVDAIREFTNEFEVEAGGEVYRCRKLVIANGPWSNRALSHFGLQLPLTITQEQVTYFAPQTLSDFEIGRFPIWIWMDEPSFYGFPVFGEAGIKVGQDVGGKEVTADSRSFDPDPDALERVTRFVQQYLPSGLGRIIYTKSCLYTLTPDRDFVIDRIPGRSNCCIAIGAGHAFKYASLIGKILSELAIDDATTSDISAFQITRDILTQANPPKNFMV